LQGYRILIDFNFGKLSYVQSVQSRLDLQLTTPTTLTKEIFKNIYSQHVSAIRNYIYYRSADAVLADDITQETFIKLWEKDFIYEEDKIKSLLYTIANGLFLDYVRKQKRQTEYITEIKFHLKNQLDEPIQTEILKRKCEKALVNLNEKERVVFLMSRKDELKYTEIAERLNLSVKAIEKRMANALKKLKLMIK
jgi:RNA polymerase sigma-70 factor (ECF subfamily)